MEAEIIQLLEDLADSKGIDPVAFVAFCENQHYTEEDADEAIKGFEDAYIGEYGSAEEFAEEWADNEGLRIPDLIVGHIDWQGVWDSELRHDFYELEGHYFRNI